MFRSLVARSSSSLLPASRVTLPSSASSSAPTPYSAFRSTSSRQYSASSDAAASSKLTEGEAAIEATILKHLVGAQVQVQDVSGGCGSFYSVSIAHSSFKGLSTLKQHQMVNTLLADQIKGMHGIQLKTSAE